MSPRKELHSEPITRKDEFRVPKSHNHFQKEDSYLRVFGGVDRLYDMVRRENMFEPVGRKLNPTYLSSQLGV